MDSINARDLPINTSEYVIEIKKIAAAVAINAGKIGEKKIAETVPAIVAAKIAQRKNFAILTSGNSFRIGLMEAAWRTEDMRICGRSKA
ncbi:MAG: hypothetical protein KIS76_08330 [Pyrinomonadaceae bacterium]|nr:hypothetical protein [Pyrinomonadaceae bacterium]